MRKGDLVTEEKLKEEGYKYILNYGGWEVWGKENSRIYWSRPTGKIEQMCEAGKFQ